MKSRRMLLYRARKFGDVVEGDDRVIPLPTPLWKDDFWHQYVKEGELVVYVRTSTGERYVIGSAPFFLDYRDTALPAPRVICGTPDNPTTNYRIEVSAEELLHIVTQTQIETPEGFQSNPDTLEISEILIETPEALTRHGVGDVKHTVLNRDANLSIDIKDGSGDTLTLMVGARHGLLIDPIFAD